MTDRFRDVKPWVRPLFRSRWTRWPVLVLAAAVESCRAVVDVVRGLREYW